MLYVIIPSAGISQRYNQGTPQTKSKLFELIHNRPIIEHTINAFIPFKEVTGIVISTHHPTSLLHILQPHGNRCILAQGGNTRSQSVYNAFQCIPNACRAVLIHDAARPNPSKALIRSILNKLTTSPVVIPTIPITDTIKSVENNTILGTVDRTTIRAAQTPQGFCYKTLKTAYHRTSSIDDFTDESMLLESQGVFGTVIEGDVENIKVTRPSDVKWLNFLMATPPPSVTG
jgi:2-C-methyl-D-erythritol 4-phosphate cytidylyltransferase